ncbi:MAG: MarR family transcriptional regulator [Burkholderiales bacterium]|nr:MarR family transcriptional regulator [Burkholderiales bacterium]
MTTATRVKSPATGAARKSTAKSATTKVKASIKPAANGAAKPATKVKAGAKPAPRPARIPPLASLPGHYIRRLQQIAVALFLEETEAHNITPVQYAALSAAKRQPGMDQRTLASSIGFDTSTIGGVIDRLERRGLIERQASERDRRVRLLVVTTAGAELLQQLTKPVMKSQQRILAPLPAKQRAEFIAMLTTLVEGNNEVSRAPREDS